jgi:hypothetical protein
MLVNFLYINVALFNFATYGLGYILGEFFAEASGHPVPVKSTDYLPNCEKGKKNLFKNSFSRQVTFAKKKTQRSPPFSRGIPASSRQAVLKRG